MQLNAGGIYFMAFVILKKIKKGKEKFPQAAIIFENTYQSKRNPRDIGGKQCLFMLIFYIYMY